MENFVSIYQKRINGLLFLLSVLLTVVIVFFVFLTLNIIEQRKYIGADVTSQANISVSGKASVLATPDVAEFSFSVRHEADEVKGAQDEVARKVEAIISFLKEEGVDEKNIKTTGYSVYPRYEWRTPNRLTPDSGGERVLVGYEVVQSTNITVKEMDKAGALVGGVGERGATDVGGVTFSVEDEQKLKREARAEAIADAKEQADKLAQDLGVSIVRIVDFNESRISSPYYMRADMAMVKMEADIIETSFEPGEEEIEVEVHIVYEIR